jgi:hypothetical protein
MKSLLLALAISTVLAVHGFSADPPAATALHLKTEAAIRAVTPCVATVEQITPCSARLKTSEGNILRLGSPDAPGNVVTFIHTLRVGSTYRLPAEFLRYEETRRVRENSRATRPQ